jgi:hypothetical protein
MIPEMMTQE